MTLTPAITRLDLKCGKGAISKGETCTKGAATQVGATAKGKGTTRDLEKGTTEQLVAHREILQRELERKYAKPIWNMKQYNDYLKWSAKRPEQAEIDAVNKILGARNKARRDSIWAEGFQP